MNLKLTAAALKPTERLLKISILKTQSYGKVKQKGITWVGSFKIGGHQHQVGDSESLSPQSRHK